MDANKIDNGSTNGTMRGMANKRNFKTSTMSKSFPASSAIKSQTVCKINIKKRITNTEVNVIRNVFKRYLSSIFT